MNPIEAAVAAFCLTILGWSLVAVVSLIREAYEDKRAEQWAAEHVDPYVAQIEGEDWAAWEAEMRESAGGESRG